MGGLSYDRRNAEPDDPREGEQVDPDPSDTSTTGSDEDSTQGRTAGRNDVPPAGVREIARRLMRRAVRKPAGFWASTFGRGPGFLVPLVVGLAALGWMISGIYIVEPGHQGVVRHFGLEVGKTTPGMNYHLPWPIQQVDVVNVEAIQRLEVGFRTENGQPKRVPGEALMLTGDENIVDAQVIVQYRIRDPSLYLFRLRDPDFTLQAATQVALRSSVGSMPIDELLTTGRADAQERTRQYLQALMDSYQSGLLITEVKLQVVDPPDEVKDAFNEVVRAREDRERLENEAQAYREDILPKARGEAERTIRAAEAYEAERVLQAQGDVAQFTAVLEEYRKAEDVTRERLYLETIERALGSTDKIVIDESVGGNTLPFLPLNDLAADRRNPDDEEPQSPSTQPPTSPTVPPIQPTLQPVPTAQP